MRKNYAPRPIILAQAAAAKILGHNFSFVRELGKGDVRAIEFTNGQPVTVLWRESGGLRTSRSTRAAAQCRCSI